ncbi:histidine-rich glycoprotein-like [Microtus pennsylvanicus]|uniref:histidine-rich glycoprotein-like n=1 Tax=Microtus pennsylvanicus TaxID=10058 RepID=UPI003F6BB6D2
MRLRIVDGPKVLVRADKAALGAMLPDVSSAPTLLPFAFAWKLEEGKGLGLAGLGAEPGGDTTIYYFVLDVKEPDCWALSTKSENDCLEASWPTEIVIGQCKVIATRYSNESQDFRVNNYNCTTSSVSSALSNTKDSPVLLEYLGESEVHRQQAHKALEKYKGENDGFDSFRVDRVERVIKARGGERPNYYVDFSMWNCSTQYFHRRPPVSITHTCETCRLDRKPTRVEGLTSLTVH